MRDKSLPREREPVLVSACLLGTCCRYDGSHERDDLLRQEIAESEYETVPFCPEEHGKLGTPRPPAAIETESAAAVLDGGDRVVTDAGRDVTQAFLEGARGALDLCRERGIKRAFLKERSPSCGVQSTHVGERLVEGPGVTAELLSRAGISVTGVEGRRETST